MDHTHDAHNVHVSSRSLRDFLPLIAIVLSIFSATLIAVSLYGSWETMFVMRVFMGSFFLVFGTFKAVNIRGFAQAYAEYDIIAGRSRLYAHVYPVIELVLGVSYLIAFELFWVNIITLIVMAVSAIGVAQKLARREEVSCACLGVVFKIPMTKVTLGEDLLMATMAAGMLLL